MSGLAATLLALTSLFAALDNAEQMNGFRTLFFGCMFGVGVVLTALAVMP